MQQVGKPPACIECAHLELKAAKIEGEHTRHVDGRLMIFICGRATDPLTGKSPELCHTERQVGMCGPRGMFFEQADIPAAVIADLEEDEDIPLVGEAAAEEIEEDVILD